MSDNELDRLLGGKPDLGVTEREALLEQILAKTAAAPQPRPMFGWLRWALPAAAALVLAVPIAWRLRDDGLAARGGNAAPPSFSLSCLSEGQPAPCAVSAKLVFRVESQGYAHFAAVARSSTGELIWLLPDTPLRTPTYSGVLPDAVVIDWPKGAYVIEGFFSGAPLDRETLRAALEHDVPGLVRERQALSLP